VASVRTVIYGSRPDGHAKVVAQLAHELGGFELAGLIDDLEEHGDRTVEGLAVLGTGNDLERLRAAGVKALLLGFGAGVGRTQIVQRALAAGLELPNLVHPSAVLAPSARLGRGVQILALAYLGPDTAVGDGALVNTGAVIEHDVELESGAVVLPNATVTGRVRVERDATVGAAATVLNDVTVGAEAIVGAGSVVTRDVPPRGRVAGVPARPLGDQG
jgi:sugar O-acyltransferase (sialic acid O-acetyltransferase NeuD family)